MLMSLVAARALTRAILERPLSYEWSLQGFGMLRLCLADGDLRLHIWDDRFAVPNVSPIHDHPWDFESLIVSGSLKNTRVVDSTAQGYGSPYLHTQIKCGPGGCALGEVRQGLLCTPMPNGVRTFRPGDTYSQDADELHSTQALPGTVTIIRRTFSKADRDIANVWWKEGPWVSAEPRPATQVEVLKITRTALDTLL